MAIVPRLLRIALVFCALAVTSARPAAALTPSPQATGGTATGVATPHPVISPSPQATGTAARTAPSATPTPRAHEAAVEDAAPAAGEEVPAAAKEAAPIATAAALRPRAFRTPERSAPPAFVAPDGAAADGVDMPEPAVPAPAVGGNPEPAARGGSSVVVLRATARTGLEGFDVRVAYPPALGSFGSGSRQPDCNAGTGSFVAASDRGTGELHLVVASAQSLPFPLDVFCRFNITSAGRLSASDFSVRVAEVTSNAQKADPNLLVVTVSVR